MFSCRICKPMHCPWASDPGLWRRDVAWAWLKRRVYWRLSHTVHHLYLSIRRKGHRVVVWEASIINAGNWTLTLDQLPAELEEVGLPACSSKFQRWFQTMKPTRMSRRVILHLYLTQWKDRTGYIQYQAARNPKTYASRFNTAHANES